MLYKLGRKPATRPVGLHDLTVYGSRPFPTPPAEVAAPIGVDWGMDGNNKLGDCVIAGVDHLLAAWNAAFSEYDPRPTEAAIESTYHQLSPGDQGCVEADVLQLWQSKGIFGNRIAAYAPLNHRDNVELKQGVAFYGGVFLGIACPDSAQQEFAQQEETGHLVPWTVVPGAQVEGGHCIVAVGYSPTGLLCVSWGAVVEVTWAFCRKYIEEAWCIIPHQLVEKGTDVLGLNLATLQADLAKLPAAA